MGKPKVLFQYVPLQMNTMNTLLAYTDLNSLKQDFVQAKSKAVRLFAHKGRKEKFGNSSSWR